MTSFWRNEIKQRMSMSIRRGGKKLKSSNKIFWEFHRKEPWRNSSNISGEGRDDRENDVRYFGSLDSRRV